MDVHFSSKTDQWATPKNFFELQSSLYGPFDIDVCANETNAKCKVFFDKEKDVYIWKDAETERINKPHDPIWQKYWDRWQAETGSTCILKKTEI